MTPTVGMRAEVMARGGVASDTARPIDFAGTPHERTLDRLAVLSEAMRTFARATADEPRVIETVARRVAEVVRDSCVVLLTADDGLHVEPAAVFDPDPETRGHLREALSEPLRLERHALVRGVLETGAPFFAPYMENARLPTGTRIGKLLRELAVHSILIVPLRAHDRSIGVMVLARFREESPAFEPEDLELAQDLAAHAALGITNARLLAEARRACDEKNRVAERLRILTDSAHAFGAATFDLDRLLDVIACRLGEVVGDMCALRMTSDDGQWLEANGAAFHRDPELLAATRAVMSSGRQRIGEGISGRVVASRLPILQRVVRPDEYAAASEPRYRAYLERLEVTSAIAVPLLCRGEALGVANLMRTGAGPAYTEEDLAFVQSLAGHAALAIANARSLAAVRAARDVAEEAVRARRQAEARFTGLSEAGVIGIVAEEQRALLAAIVSSTADAIIAKRLDGTIVSCNQGGEQLFGYAAAEIVGRSVKLLIPPGLEAEEERILATVARGEVLHLDTVRRRKDGRDIDVSVTFSPVRDPAGRIVGISKIAHDITGRRRAEEALAGAKERAEAANRELEAFSYSVAHDLRAPLRGMSGFAQILLEDYADRLDPDGQDALREIRANAEKMGQLIDALLSLSRVTRSDWKPAWIDLSAVARASAAQLSATEPDRHMTLLIEEDLWARADPQLTRSLFDNLLGNSWKFTGKVPKAEIELGSIESNGERTLFIRDNGAGFDMAHASKLFAPFQRVHSAAEFPGTGIGLATVQRIVQRHGGRIWAEGRVGAGATFFLTWPGIAQGRGREHP
jgi:PAS domain S-box-containing protein